jgi:hypothetical protein
MLATEEGMLDNPGYASLCGAHAGFAQVRGRARRYPDDVAPFLALPSPPSAQDWRDAVGLVAPGAFVAGRYGAAELPDGWRAVRTFDLVQMIEERVTGADCAEASALGARLPARHEHQHGGDPALRGARLSRAPTRDADGRHARADPGR